MPFWWLSNCCMIVLWKSKKNAKMPLFLKNIRIFADENEYDLILT